MKHRLKRNGLLLGTLFCAAISGQPLFAQSTPASAGKSEAEQWREDLRFMAQEMPKYHKNLFHTMTREQFENAISKLDERIPSLASRQDAPRAPQLQTSGVFQGRSARGLLQRRRPQRSR